MSQIIDIGYKVFAILGVSVALGLGLIVVTKTLYAIIRNNAYMLMMFLVFFRQYREHNEEWRATIDNIDGFFAKSHSNQKTGSESHDP